MKKHILRLSVIFLFVSISLLSSCGLMSSLKDATNNASQLLKDMGELTRLIDSKVENGEISQEIGDMIDEKIENLAAVLEAAIQNNGGFLFDQVNGSVDNIFVNVSLLLDQVKQGVLDDSLPSLITQISASLQLQTNLLTSALEDIIVITIGNTIVLVDKTTNAVIIIASIILLAVGLLIFGLVLFKKGGQIRGAKLIGTIFMVLYIAFFLSVALSSHLRGYIIAGFDFGKKVEAIAVKPKITGVVPETFVLGKNKRIIVYGNHLNEIESFDVKLLQGNSTKLTFPQENIIVATRNRIVLGNFEPTLQWVIPKYPIFINKVNQKTNINIGVDKWIKYTDKINGSLYPKPALATSLSPGLTLSLKPKYTVLETITRSAAKAELGSSIGPKLNDAVVEVFKSTFNLSPGDYGLNVFAGEDRVESPQFISIVNPPPPAPKPDLYPIGLSWSGGLTPVAKQQTSLDVKIGIAYPEEVTKPFKARITASPAITPIEVTVPMGDIAAASSSNSTTVRTRNFAMPNHGNYTFTVTVDNQNVIGESNETNNAFSKPLTVKRYIYDIVVQFVSFQSTANNEDGTDEYRIKLHASATGYSPWSKNFDKNGNPGTVYDINYSATFNNQLPGQIIIVSTSGKESDSGFRNGDDNLGSDNHPFKLSQNPTGNNNYKEYTHTLNTGKYKIIVKFKVTRRII
jgi:hypothetical protein